MTENEVTIDGVRYVAVECCDCSGCAGDKNRVLCANIHSAGSECGPEYRVDGRSIIWQEAPDELTALRELNRELVEALERAQQDINWMLNSQKFLNGHVFDYIDTIIAKARGEK